MSMQSLRKQRLAEVRSEACLGEFDVAVEEILELATSDLKGSEHVQWMIRLHIGKVVDAVETKVEARFQSQLRAERDRVLERERRKTKRRQTESCGKENAAPSQALAECRRKASELEQALTDRDRKVSELELALADRERKVVDLDDALSRKDAEASDRLLSHAEKVHDLTAKIRELETQEAILCREGQRKVDESQSRLAERESELAAMTHERNQLQEQQQTLAKVTDVPHASMQDVEEARRRAETLERERDDWSKQLMHAGEDLKRSVAERNLLKEQLGAAEASVKALTEEKCRLERQVTELEATSRDEAEVVAKETAGQREDELMASVQELDQQRQALEAKASDANQQLNVLSAERDELERECRKLRKIAAERDTLKRQFSELEGQLATAAAERDAFEETLLQRNRELDVLVARNVTEPAARVEPEHKSPRQDDTQDFATILRNLSTRADAIQGGGSTEGHRVGRGGELRVKATLAQEDTQDLAALLNLRRGVVPTASPTVPPMREPLETTENLADLLSATAAMRPAVPPSAQPPSASSQDVATSSAACDPTPNAVTTMPPMAACARVPPKTPPQATRVTKSSAMGNATPSALPTVPPMPEPLVPLARCARAPPKTPPLGARALRDDGRPALSTAAAITRPASTTPPPAARRHELDVGAERALLSASLSAGQLPSYASASAFGVAGTPTQSAYGAYALVHPTHRLTSRKRIMGAVGSACNRPGPGGHSENDVPERDSQLQDAQRFTRRFGEEPQLEPNERSTREVTVECLSDKAPTGSGTDDCDPTIHDRDADRAAGPFRSLWQRLSFRK